MKKLIPTIIFIAFLIFGLTSCSKETAQDITIPEMPDLNENIIMTGDNVIVISYPPVLNLAMSKPVMEEAFERAGINVEFLAVPAERSLEYANNNTTQGELSRIGGIEEYSPNLIRIPIPNNFIRIYPIASNPDIHIHTIDDLRPYRLGAQRGAKMIERETLDMDIEWGYEFLDVLYMLDQDRIDIALDTDTIFLQTRNDPKLVNSDKMSLAGGPVIEVEMYCYIHKNYPEVIEKLTQVMIEMENEGVIESILQKEKEALLESIIN